MRGVGNTRYEPKIVVGELGGLRQFERRRCSLEDNGKTDFKYVHSL